jgi:hypothetical protein
MLSLDLQGQLVLRQLALEALVASAQPIVLDLLGRAFRRPRLRGQFLERTDVTSAAPLHDVRGVQPFPPQQSALRTRIAEAFVLIEDDELVLGGEPPPRRLRRGVVVTHAAIMGARQQGCRGHGHGST